MKIGSLFSGIGGLEHGIERALGGQVVWQVEVDPWCREVLAKHWPQADRSVTDVRCATRDTVGHVDVLCGGFPCQDVSAAGKGAGLSGERSGLWYEYLRLVRELQPRAVVVENVASGATRWLVPVRRMLEAVGYRTRAVGLSAGDVGAPHLRRRIFVLALANSQGAGRELVRSAAESHGGRANVADALRSRSQGNHVAAQTFADAAGCGEQVQRASVEPRLGRVPHGISDGLDSHQWPAGQGEFQYDHEPPRTIEKGQDKERRARLKALGNAVVPQCAYVAGLILRDWMAGTC